MSKSMTAAILVMFAGYTVASYGYVLLRGWDIPFKSWVDPLDAYRWPTGGAPGFIPSGQVFPNQGALALATGPPIQQTLNQGTSGG